MSMLRVILCFIGFHKCDYVISMNDDPPPYAKCKYCNKRYDDNDFEGYPS